MSIPHNLLRDLAELHKPKLPIKPTSTWVAVLLHTKMNIKDIQEERDFMWVKCHDRITLKTIKYQYFARHPLEDFKLKHRNEYPKLVRTVGLLRKRERTDSNIIVLRALEPHHADDEDKARRTAAHVEEVPEEAPARVENAILIDEGEDHMVAPTKTKASIKAPKTETQAKTNGRARVPTPASQISQSEANVKIGEHRNGRREVSESSSEDVEVLEQENSSTHEGSSQHDEDRQSDASHVEPPHKDGHTNDVHEFSPEILAEYHDPSSQLLSEQEAYYVSPAYEALDHHTNTAIVSPTHYATTNFDEQIDLDRDMNDHEEPVDELLRRIDALPEPFRSHVSNTNYHACEVPTCRKAIHLKAWTQFGPNYGPLCTRCSALRVENDPAALKELQDQVATDYYRKEALNRQGHMQNMDDDAPEPSTPSYWGYGPIKTDDDIFNTPGSLNPSVFNNAGPSGDHSSSSPTAPHLAYASAFLNSSFTEDDQGEENDISALLDPNSVLVNTDSFRAPTTSTHSTPPMVEIEADEESYDGFGRASTEFSDASTTNHQPVSRRPIQQAAIDAVQKRHLSAHDDDENEDDGSNASESEDGGDDGYEQDRAMEDAEQAALKATEAAEEEDGDYEGSAGEEDGGSEPESEDDE